ncbi:MAG: RsmD family RNA methyltransferase, partial [Promicromonosporaceae bacterium]|nr:RsmD family RNA methyltransferase [Promicromonosporaceae bacterium]
GSKFWRADAVQVLGNPSPDRVPSAWPEAGPGGVGGGELAHVSLPGQRRWKAAVLREQLRRLANLDWEVTVEAAPGDGQRGGLHYRTRIDLVADREGRAGMRTYRSHQVLPLDTMPLATEEVLARADAEQVFARRWRPGQRLELHSDLLLVDGAPWRGRPDTRANARRSVTEMVELSDGSSYRYRLAADGFWQNHREAPRLLVEAVLAAAGDLTGKRVLDLYSGAGLFTLPLADRAGSVIAVEGDERAVRDARRNSHHLGNVELRHGAVERVLDGGLAAGVVVLDPPRAGAGRRTIEAIMAGQPERVIYVACDPAALARDIGYLGEGGYTLQSLRAFDLFPMTHHVEAVALLTR